MIEVIHMEQTYGEHHIQMIAEKKVNQWDVIARCDQCVKHMHFTGVDFNDKQTTLFITAEFSMHASGVDHGWADGIGFDLQD